MLTLDAPERLRCDAPPIRGTSAAYDEAFRLLDLVASVRGSFDQAPRTGTRLDPDRLYLAHGDPRD